MAEQNNNALPEDQNTQAAPPETQQIQPTSPPSYLKQGESIAQQLQQSSPEQQPEKQDSGRQGGATAQQSAPQPKQEEQPQHKQEERPQQSSPKRSMPSESDLAKSQLKLLSLTNRTLLDILFTQENSGEELCVDEATLEILMRNQVIYERIVDGFQK